MISSHLPIVKTPKAEGLCQSCAQGGGSGAREGYYRGRRGSVKHCVRRRGERTPRSSLAGEHRDPPADAARPACWGTARAGYARQRWASAPARAPRARGGGGWGTAALPTH